MELFKWDSSMASVVLWTALCSRLLPALCFDDDELTDKMVQDLMEQQRKNDEERKRSGEVNVTTTERSSIIIKPRGELTGDLLRHHLIADFIHDVPFIVCTVEWVEGNFADLGNLIPVDVVDHQPYWLDWRGNKSEYYTFIMSGLDEPSRKEPTLREYQHWILVNIPGNKFEAGETLVAYKGPKPKQNTGMHRHGIVVYKQPGKITFKEKPILSWVDDKNRGNFSNMKFAEHYNFGEPVAINFFQTEWTPPPTLPSSMPDSLYTKKPGHETHAANITNVPHTASVPHATNGVH